MGGGVSKKDDKITTIGVKISFFDEFIAKCGGESVLRGLSTATVCEKILKPLTDKHAEIPSSSYCQQLLLEKNTSVGLSEVLICHCMFTTFLDVVKIIKYHFRDQSEIYIWFDLFSLDLHKEIDNFGQFCNAFSNTIKNFNYVVLVLPNWDDLKEFTRLWCNYELYCAYFNKCKFEVAMSLDQQEKFFVSTLYDTMNTLDKIKNIIDCENSNCYYPYRDRLFMLLNTIGYNNINNSIFNLIRDWMLYVMQKSYDDSSDEKEKLIIKYAIAHIYRTQDKNDEAEAYYVDVLDGRRSILGEDHIDTIHNLFNLASFYDDNDQFEKAESLYNESLVKSKKVLTEYHPYTIGISNNLAALYMNNPSNVGLIKISLDQLFIKDVEDAGSIFDKQDPALIITINDQVFRTNRIQEGGTTAVFPEAFELMANYSDEISIDVINMDGFGFTKAKIGFGKIKIYHAIPNIDEQTTFTIKLKNSHGEQQGLCQMRIACQPFHISSVKLKLDELSVSDVEDAGSMFDKQDPALKVSVGGESFKTNRVQEGGTSATFTEVFEINNAKYSDDITVQVVNMDGLGLTKKTIGNGKIKIYQAVPKLDEPTNFLIGLSNSKDQPQGTVSMRGIASITDEMVIDQKGIGYEKAENLWAECLSLQLEIYGNLNVETIGTMERLATLYNRMKKYDKVQYMYEQVLASHKLMYGLEDSLTLTTIESLAASFMLQEQPKKAEPLYSFVLDTRKKKLGEDNPLTLASMESLAILYHKSKFHHAAQPLLEKCMEKRKLTLGENNPLTINVMCSLAEVYKDLGENFKAEKLYIQVLQKFKELKGEGHPSTLNLHHIVASFYAYKKGELKKAEELLVSCFEKQKEIFGDDHHSTKHSSNALNIVRKKIEIKEACYQ